MVANDDDAAITVAVHDNEAIFEERERAIMTRERERERAIMTRERERAIRTRERESYND